MHETEQHAEYDLLMQSQFWPADRIRNLQRERLEKLVRHARAHVPFYQTRLDVLFRPDGSLDWDRWGEVPILKRADLLDHRRRMLARTVPDGAGNINDVSTSGSTGRPVTTSHTALAHALSHTAVFRADTWHGIDYSARLGSWSGSRSDVGSWPEGRRKFGWGPWWDPRSAQGEFVEVNRHTSAPDVVEFMVRNRVRYITGGGTDLRLLGHEAERLGVTLSIDVAMVRSADITEPGRILLARVFGARCVSLYSSREGHRMAHQCPAQSNWHVNDEQVLVEILDDEGHPCASGVPGRVVITPFNSFAQPLIRYEQGDLATRGAACSCGRHLSVLEGIVGRVKHMFVLADGSRVAPWLSDAAVASLNGAMFQVAQTAPDAIEVRYVPGDRIPDEAIVRGEIDALLRGSARITFVPLKRFEVPAGRKHLEFVSELGDQP